MTGRGAGRLTRVFAALAGLALAAGLSTRAAAQDAPDPVDGKVIAQRTELAAWCLEQKLLDESAAQLRIASIMGGGPATDDMWQKLLSAVPPVPITVTATIEGGTAIRGTTAPGACLLTRAEGKELLLLDSIRRLTFVEARGEELVFRVERDDDEATGSVAGGPLDIVCSLGPITVPLDKVRTLEILGTPVQPESAQAVVAVRHAYEALTALRRMSEQSDLAPRIDLYALCGALDYYSTSGGDPLATSVASSLLAETCDLMAKMPERYPRVRVLTAKMSQERRDLLVMTKAYETMHRGPLDMMYSLSGWGWLRYSLSVDDPAGAPRSAKAKTSPVEKEGVTKVIKEAVEWAAAACPSCGGFGFLPCPACRGLGRSADGQTCPKCNGRRMSPCEACRGARVRKSSDDPPPPALPSAKRGKLTQGIAPIVMDDYRARLAGIDKLHMAMLVRRSEEQLDANRADAARASLRLAAAVDATSDELLAGCVRFAEHSPGVASSVSATLEDGTSLKGACSLRPLVLRHTKGILLATPAEVRRIEMLAPRDGAPQARIETAEGVFEGRLAAPPIDVRTTLGALSLPLLKTRTLEFHVN